MIAVGEWYMVKDTVWVQTGCYAGPTDYPWDQTYLCIGCLERRFGRRLNRADFKDVPINNPTNATADIIQTDYSTDCTTQQKIPPRYRPLMSENR
jgi:hypothetical protein